MLAYIENVFRVKLFQKDDGLKFYEMQRLPSTSSIGRIYYLILR